MPGFSEIVGRQACALVLTAAREIVSVRTLWRFGLEAVIDELLQFRRDGVQDLDEVRFDKFGTRIAEFFVVQARRGSLDLSNRQVTSHRSKLFIRSESWLAH